jgi:hypothetical protein
MQRTWRNQFRDYPVPSEIIELVSSGAVQDTSWGDNVCPSFEMYRHGQGIRIWVDHPDPRQREMKTPVPFTITLSCVTPRNVYGSYRIPRPCYSGRIPWPRFSPSSRRLIGNRWRG